MKQAEHCIDCSCMFFQEGDNCWYWRHRKDGLRGMKAEYTILTQPIWKESRRDRVMNQAERIEKVFDKLVATCINVESCKLKCLKSDRERCYRGVAQQIVDALYEPQPAVCPVNYKCLHAKDCQALSWVVCKYKPLEQSQPAEGLLTDQWIEKTKADAEQQSWEHRAHPKYEKEKYMLAKAQSSWQAEREALLTRIKQLENRDAQNEIKFEQHTKIIEKCEAEREALKNQVKSLEYSNQWWKKYSDNVQDSWQAERKSLLLATTNAYHDENQKLRSLLWATHPCEGKYGDDGELQCGRYIPFIDFRRDSVAEIEQKTMLHNRACQKQVEMLESRLFDTDKSVTNGTLIASVANASADTLKAVGEWMENFYERIDASSDNQDFLLYLTSSINQLKQGTMPE